MGPLRSKPPCCSGRGFGRCRHCPFSYFSVRPVSKLDRSRAIADKRLGYPHGQAELATSLRRRCRERRGFQGRGISRNTKAGENLTFRGPFELALSPTQRIANVKANLTAENGEILWGKFFAELKSQRPELIVDALRARAASANFSPGAFFDFFVKKNFKRQHPRRRDPGRAFRRPHAYRANWKPKARSRRSPRSSLTRGLTTSNWKSSPAPFNSAASQASLIGASKIWF